jgi:hypothetical protein
MEMKGELKATIIMLTLSLGFLYWGTTLPKDQKMGLTICNAQQDDRGYIQGIVTSSQKKDRKLHVNLTEGTSGCNALLIASTDLNGYLAVGNRVKVKVKVDQPGIFELDGGVNSISKDPTVVDTSGEIEQPLSLTVKLNSYPEFLGANKYAELTIFNPSTGNYSHLKVSEEIRNELKLGKNMKIYYYPSTWIVNQVEEVPESEQSN